MDRTDVSRIFTTKMPYENVEPEAIVLVGRADLGPRMIPIKGNNLNQVISLFGRDSELTNAYIETSQICYSPIYLIKIDGNYYETDIQNKIKITAIDSLNETNTLSYSIKTIESSEETLSETYLFLNDFKRNLFQSYNLTDKTLKEIVDEINTDNFSNVHNFYAETDSEESTDMLSDASETFFISEYQSLNGQHAITFARLEDILMNLLGSSIKQLGILCGDFFRYSGALYNLVSNFTMDMIRNNQPLFVTIGVDTEFPEEHLYNLLKEFIQKNTEYIISEYINVIVSKLSIANASYNYVSNGVGSYCGLISNLSIGESLTNKNIPNIKENLLDFDTDKIKELSDFGLVFFSRDGFNNAKIYKGINLLYGTNGVYYTKELIEGEMVAIEHFKPLSLGYLSNMYFIQNLYISIRDNISMLLKREAVKSFEFKVAVEEVLNKYSNLIRKYNISINQEEVNFNKVCNINIEMTLIGELDNLSIAMSLM